MSQNESDREQVQALLTYIDATQSEAVKNSIFSELGRGCFIRHKMGAWVDSFDGDAQAFLDRINVQNASKYWERLEYNEDRSALLLTGRIVDRCACAYASGPQPPESLCHYCCKRFQEEIFGRLLGRAVEVEITEAYLLGGQRCSTKIHILPE